MIHLCKYNIFREHPPLPRNFFLCSRPPYLKPKSSYRRFGISNAFVRVIPLGFFGAGYFGGSIVVLEDDGAARIADRLRLRLRVTDTESIGVREQRRVSADDPFLPRKRIAKRQNSEGPDGFYRHAAQYNRTHIIVLQRLQQAPKIY